jgi:CheY-like chemotaxis protein
LPVIFLTARAQRGEQDTAMEVGAIACLTKPFDPLTIGGELMAILQP